MALLAITDVPVPLGSRRLVLRLSVPLEQRVEITHFTTELVRRQCRSPPPWELNPCPLYLCWDGTRLVP